MLYPFVSCRHNTSLFCRGLIPIGLFVYVCIPAWLGSLVILSVGLYGPLAGKLNDRFSSRWVAIFGGLLCAAGTGASSQAPNLDVLFITLGFVFGLGACLVFVSLYLIVPKYFIKRRSLALGILSMGPGAGLFLISPLIQTLMETYTWRGAFLVWSAVLLILCFLAMTFDPNVAEMDMEEKPIAPDVPSRKARSTVASLLHNRDFLIYTFGLGLTYYGHYVPVVHMVSVFSEKTSSRVQINKLTMVFRRVDSYLPRFTSSHGQNLVDSRGAAEWVSNTFWPCDDVNCGTVNKSPHDGKPLSICFFPHNI